MAKQSTHINYGMRTHIGRVRDHNEDSMIAIPPLFAVADGMGGHEAGEVASEIVINTLADLAPAIVSVDALSGAVQSANLDVIEAPSKGIGRDGMGTTLTAAILKKERLTIAQVGDSRAYLYHNHRLQQVTRDHSLIQDMIESGQITKEEAKHHPNRSVITRAIGSDPYMRPDMYELNVSAGDRLLLCSDGLNTMVSDREIKEILGRYNNPQTCADELVEAALVAGGSDNVTVIVVDIEGDKEGMIRSEKRRSARFIAAIGIMLAFALALTAFGGYTYVNNSAYLINEDGKISVYKGLPEEFLGMKLSSFDHKTNVEVSKLSPGVSKRINEGMQVDSLDEANRLVKTYEEEIARAEATKVGDNA